jgi:hypothetical protein
MTRGTIAEYAAAVRERYRAVGKREQGWILDEFCRSTGCYRKAAIRLLRPRPPAPVRAGGGHPRAVSGSGSGRPHLRPHNEAAPPCSVTGIAGSIRGRLPYPRNCALAARKAPEARDFHRSPARQHPDLISLPARALCRSRHHVAGRLRRSVKTPDSLCYPDHATNPVSAAGEDRGYGATTSPRRGPGDPAELSAAT